MKSKIFPILIIVSYLILNSWKYSENNWLTEKHSGYDIYYTSGDINNIKEYNKFFENGLKSTETFFNSTFDNKFFIYIHPNRNSLDSTWQKEWNMPDFKSECWMVASGTADRVDIISPLNWDKEACEHIYTETSKTQNLITHELVHVFHGQKNISKDFSAAEGIDWLIEGLAVYASGQSDTTRISEVKKAIMNNEIPENLDGFWSGKNKYGLSGTLVMYIDFKYGREKLIELLPLSKKSEVLTALKVTEQDLLDSWKFYMKTI